MDIAMGHLAINVKNGYVKVTVYCWECGEELEDGIIINNRAFCDDQCLGRYSM